MDEQEFLNMSMSLRLRDIAIQFGTLQNKSVEQLTESLKLVNKADALIQEQALLRENIQKLIKDLDEHELSTGKGLYLQELADASN
tara:strand:+ start:736 stop:993 length:258 start_codon:yes stop_codon:yes gene_type:complete